MRKLKTRDELAGIIGALKAEGKRVIFTNGCFDIIHAGHIQYLREARALGDVLVVGVNSDESVSRLKPKRPIVPLEERLQVLDALEMVDYLVVFEEDTPYDLIKALRPTMVVKGGDWKEEEIVGRDLVEEVKSLGYRPGMSTSEIIDRIIKRYCK
jgi:rfaE bifunctional protein nucleotidyltransferase chain/domain